MLMFMRSLGEKGMRGGLWKGEKERKREREKRRERKREDEAYQLSSFLVRWADSWPLTSPDFAPPSTESVQQG